MKKPRLFISLIALFFLIGAACLLWPGHRAALLSPTAFPPAGAPARAPAPAVSVKTTATDAPHSSSRPDSAAIGRLLADASLDNQNVMTGLTKMTLAADLPLAERTEAMAHLLNLSVEDPSPILLPLVGDTRLPDALCTQILDDALNGSLAWQADSNFAALSHRNGLEIRAKAHDHLVFLVGADHGDNLLEWRTAIALTKEKWAQVKN
jgi:hypothetical protein